ncbi:hypothetical protein HMPREF0379_0712 [[Eubacterium] yurii subsp. margaretiae ATCC 43715]|nr:hypothetical protein HMPREF0379_0712 [[Eubacterium] yurii subsp. margaretiae ATCC 43715]
MKKFYFYIFAIYLNFNIDKVKIKYFFKYFTLVLKHKSSYFKKVFHLLYNYFSIMSSEI